MSTRKEKSAGRALSYTEFGISWSNREQVAGFSSLTFIFLSKQSPPLSLWSRPETVSPHDPNIILHEQFVIITLTAPALPFIPFTNEYVCIHPFNKRLESNVLKNLSKTKINKKNSRIFIFFFNNMKIITMVKLLRNN